MNGLARLPHRSRRRLRRGYVRLLDTRYEVRDAQDLIALLVDEGLVDGDRIGATGGSYGGGMSMSLAALRNRQMMPDGSLVAGRPDGTPLSLAAAAPEIPWTDLSYSLVPNGGNLDYIADASYSPPTTASGSRRRGGSTLSTSAASSRGTTPPREKTPTPTCPAGASA